MNKRQLGKMTTAELVERYAEIGIEQSSALLDFGRARFNRLFHEHIYIATTLQSRPGDQRKELVKLYKHPNTQTRLNAAKETLAIAPVAARQQIEAIAAGPRGPHALDARMCLRALDEGIFLPQ